jgi:branched-chain amino acid transport system permease protein
MLLLMMASGLTLIFSMMGVLNFAHASFYMLGAYFGFEISRHIGFWPGFVIAPVFVGVLGALVEHLGLRRLPGFSFSRPVFEDKAGSSGASARPCL